MITAIVTSDNHLGAYWARLRADRLETRRRHLQRNFERVVDAALETKADLFLQAGDLFDRPDPRNAERLFVARQFARLREAAIPIFAVAGNHDSPRSLGYDGGTLPHQEAAALGAIHLFRETNHWQSTALNIKGHRVCVAGMSSNFNLPDGACPLEEYSIPTWDGDIKIALLHYGVEGWAPPFGREPVLSLPNLEKLGADAICVGHLHKKNLLRLPGGGVLLNPSATEHINFGEEKLECGYWILRFDNGKVESEYHALPTQAMKTHVVYFDNKEDDLQNLDGDLTSHIEQEIESVSDAEQLLRVQLEGELTREQFQTLDLSRLVETGNARNFLFRMDVDKLMVRDRWSELPLGFGVSFDVHEELQNTARAMTDATPDEPQQIQRTRRAAREIEARFAAWSSESTRAPGEADQTTVEPSTPHEVAA